MKKIFLLLSLLSLLFCSKVDRSITHKTYESIQIIQKLLLDKNSSGALTKLQYLHKKIDNNRIKDYEKAFVDRMFAFVYISDNNYDDAVKYFEKAYEYKAFIDKEQFDILKNLAQISMVRSEFKEAIRLYHEYFKLSSSKDSGAYIALASAYNEIKDIKNAIFYTKEAIKNSKKPKKSWYEMLLALYYMQNDYKMSIDTQEILIKKFGTKKEYLSTLSALYQYTNRTKKALSTLELSHDMDYLEKKQDYLRLSYMLLSSGLPQKSAVVLQEGIDGKIFEKDKEVLRLLADSYSFAKDDKKALETYKELANIDNDGNVYAQVAQTYLNLDDFSSAIEFFNKAIESKNLKNIEGVYLLLGICYYETKNYKKAKESFNKAKSYEKTKKSANEWLKYTRKRE